MDLIKVHRAVMDLIVESPGCSGFTPYYNVNHKKHKKGSPKT
jgi:hypothetical protein